MGKTLNVKAQRHSLGGVTVVFDDVTEKLTLKSSFQTQIDVQRATLNNLAEGVAVFGADGRLALYNKSFRTMWALQNAQIANRHIDSLAEHVVSLAPKSGAAMADIKKRIVSFTPEDRVATLGREIGLKDGKTFTYATSPLPDGATLVTFLDVTDSRERQKELESRNTLLEETHRIKTKFVDNVSKQLRDPLNTIIGFSEMLEMQLAGELNDRQKDYVASILTASNRQLDLVNDIITMQMIDAGQMQLDMAEVDVHALIEKAVTYSTLKAADTEVTLEIECEKDVGVIKADEQRLRQVLFNLLSNAFAFTEPGGKVTVGARREGDAVRLFVRDTGRGVEPDDQARAFDRFEAAGQGAGAGVGLSLVNAYVKLHGGLVALSSTPGQGTTVTCHLFAGGPGAASDEVTAEEGSLNLDALEEEMRAAS
jgi:signal transduction histidine kinase